jgi:isoleucyl-tRNA synthetase
MINMLWNSYRFYEMYAAQWKGAAVPEKSTHILDRWILGECNALVTRVTEAMDVYDLVTAGRELRDFLEAYSTWYLRRSRDRVKSEGDDCQYALATMRHVLRTYACLIAPIMPFIAESVYRGIGSEKESVHLESWPEPLDVPSDGSDAHGSSDSLNAAMKNARAIVSLGLQARAEKNIKVRQSLAKLTVRKHDFAGSDDILFSDVQIRQVIADEVNVKDVVFADTLSAPVELDTVLTPELIKEGHVREIIRSVQGMRKTKGLTPGEKAVLAVSGSPDGVAVIRDAEADIMHTAALSRITYDAIVPGGEEVKIGDNAVTIALV